LRGDWITNDSPASKGLTSFSQTRFSGQAPNYAIFIKTRMLAGSFVNYIQFFSGIGMTLKPSSRPCPSPELTRSLRTSPLLMVQVRMRRGGGVIADCLVSVTTAAIPFCTLFGSDRRQFLTARFASSSNQSLPKELSAGLAVLLESALTFDRNSPRVAGFLHIPKERGIVIVFS
jgi:hypothetical protein